MPGERQKTLGLNHAPQEPDAHSKAMDQVTPMFSYYSEIQKLTEFLTIQ